MYNWSDGWREVPSVETASFNTAEVTFFGAGFTHKFLLNERQIAGLREKLIQLKLPEHVLVEQATRRQRVGKWIEEYKNKMPRYALSSLEEILKDEMRDSLKIEENKLRNSQAVFGLIKGILNAYPDEKLICPACKQSVLAGELKKEEPKIEEQKVE